MSTEALKQATDEQIAAGLTELHKGMEQRYETWENVLQRVYGAMTALTQATASGQGEPVAWEVWWGVCDMQPHPHAFYDRADAEEYASAIKSNTEVRPLFRNTAQPAPAKAEPPAGTAAKIRAALQLLNATQNALGVGLANHQPGHERETISVLLGLHDCEAGYRARKGLADVLVDIAALTSPASQSPAPAKLPQGFATSRDGDDWRVTLIFKDGDDAKALAGYMDLQGVPAANALAVEPAPAARPMPDDRDAFEAWIAKDGGDLSTFGTGVNTHYHNSAVNNAWTGWLARARIGSQPTAPAVKCQTCNGHGLVGGHMQDGSGHGEGCPDCNPEPTAPAVPAEVSEAKWCEYIAAALDCWLLICGTDLFTMEKAHRLKAIEAIVIRRMWTLKISAAPAAAVPAVPEDVQRDAERYRFIRDADRSDCITNEISLYAMESLDEYVDAAMEGEKALLASAPTSTDVKGGV